MEFGNTVHEHHHDSPAMPSRWPAATDDPIATAANVRETIGVDSRIEADLQFLDPRAHGFGHIGHMSFFSSKKKRLREYATDRLDGFAPARSEP